MTHTIKALPVALLMAALPCGACAVIHKVAEVVDPAPDAPPSVEKAPYPRHDDPDAYLFDDLPIRLFFHSQTPPPQTEVLRPVKVIFAMDAKGHSCRETGVKGLKKLQRVAVRGRAQAVVNIRSTWRDEVLGDDLTFGCALERGEYKIVWEGALANIPVVQPEEGADPEETPSLEEPVESSQDTTSAKIRKLQQLYYQGLITREEYEERRSKLLDEI